MNLFRIHIRPSGGNANMNDTFQYCLNNGLLGVGWRVEKLSNTRNWEEYEQAAAEHYESIQQPRYIRQLVSVNDLVWTRDPSAQYYLTKVTRGWEYWQNHEGRDSNIDIANIFRCDFEKIQLDAVPGTVVSSFSNRGRTIQRVNSPSALAYSQHLWNDRAKRQDYEVDMAEFPDIFTMLDAEETEDLVFLYLQSQGWYVVPNSRKGNTMRFEFMLTHSKSNEKAVVQVKTGRRRLDFDDYANDPDDKLIFLFQSNSHYDGKATDRVKSISRDELVSFLRERRDLFPKSFQEKLDLVDGARRFSPSVT